MNSRQTQSGPVSEGSEARRPGIVGAIAVAGVVFALAGAWHVWRQHSLARQGASQGAAPHMTQRVVLPVPIAPRGTDSSVSPVPLPLILTATRPGRNPREGFADIGVDAKTPQTYAAGSLLANGARVAEISRSRGRRGLSERRHHHRGSQPGWILHRWDAAQLQGTNYGFISKNWLQGVVDLRGSTAMKIGHTTGKRISLKKMRNHTAYRQLG
jgi:hypothetical protein